MYYSLTKYKKKGSYDILSDISENVTLVQLMGYRTTNVVGCWIFDSNYKRALVINRQSLYMIFPPPVGEEQVAI